MIKVKLSAIYNGKPYYKIESGRGKNKKIAHALGYKQTKELIKKIDNGKGQKIKIQGTRALKEHSKLVRLLEK